MYTFLKMITHFLLEVGWSRLNSCHLVFGGKEKVVVVVVVVVVTILTEVVSGAKEGPLQKADSRWVAGRPYFKPQAKIIVTVQYVSLSQDNNLKNNHFFSFLGYEILSQLTKQNFKKERLDAG